MVSWSVMSSIHLFELPIISLLQFLRDGHLKNSSRRDGRGFVPNMRPRTLSRFGFNLIRNLNMLIDDVFVFKSIIRVLRIINLKKSSCCHWRVSKLKYWVTERSSWRVSRRLFSIPNNFEVFSLLEKFTWLHPKFHRLFHRTWNSRYCQLPWS